jgi:hypothetical protein
MMSTLEAPVLLMVRIITEKGEHRLSLHFPQEIGDFIVISILDDGII